MPTMEEIRLALGKMDKSSEKPLIESSNIINAALYCEENKIDPSNIKPLVNKHLKEKIAYEAQSLNMLKDKTAKLPI